MRGWLSWGLVLAGLTGAVAADPPDGYPFLAYDEGLRLARAQGRPVFVYFGRYGCGYCDKTNRDAFSLAEVRERYTRNYVLVYVDAESGRRLSLPSGERITEQELGTRLSAFVTPVFLFLDPAGKELMKQVGMRKGEDFLAYDDYIQGGHYRSLSFREFAAAAR